MLHGLSDHLSGQSHWCLGVGVVVRVTGCGWFSVLLECCLNRWTSLEVLSRDMKLIVFKLRPVTSLTHRFGNHPGELCRPRSFPSPKPSVGCHHLRFTKAKWEHVEGPANSRKEGALKVLLLAVQTKQPHWLVMKIGEDSLIPTSGRKNRSRLVGKNRGSLISTYTVALSVLPAVQEGEVSWLPIIRIVLRCLKFVSVMM